MTLGPNIYCLAFGTSENDCFETDSEFQVNSLSFCISFSRCKHGNMAFITMIKVFGVCCYATSRGCLTLLVWYPYTDLKQYVYFFFKINNATLVAADSLIYLNLLNIGNTYLYLYHTMIFKCLQRINITRLMRRLKKQTKMAASFARG